MDGRPARDRLAVWTYSEHGEEIPCCYPSVTDADRAAAGRETLAQLWRAVLPRNRSRAAAQYSAGLPDGEDMVRVWRQRDPAALPAVPQPAGALDEHTFHSAALRGPRQVTVYRPPGPAGPLPGCILADGQSVSGFAQVLEPAILAGDVPPVLLVGVHHGTGPARRWPDRRSQEYLPGLGRPRFNAHLDFVTGEVIPWAASHAGAAAGPWISAGFSNGGAWAIAAAQRRPDVFAAVAAFSAGVVPQRITGRARTARVRHYLAAGTLEAGFRPATRQWAERLQRAGLPCRYQEWTGGHDHYWWEQQLPAALAWLLAPPSAPGPAPW